MKSLDLIGVDTDKSVDPAHKKIRWRLCAKEYKTKKQCNKGNSLKLRDYDISRAHF